MVIPHGGVSSTKFGERSGQEFSRNEKIDDYDAFVGRANEAFDKMRAVRMMSSDDVASVIYGAVTDSADRLRYLVGDDARGFVKARREMTEEGYIAFMREQFK
jgi:hypothetical protein